MRSLGIGDASVSALVTIGLPRRHAVPEDTSIDHDPAQDRLLYRHASRDRRRYTSIVAMSTVDRWPSTTTIPLSVVW
jgi:hypothetical protein